MRGCHRAMYSIAWQSLLRNGRHYAVQAISDLRRLAKGTPITLCAGVTWSDTIHGIRGAEAGGRVGR